jgi:hypothetical protein
MMYADIVDNPPATRNGGTQQINKLQQVAGYLNTRTVEITK